MLQQLMKTAQQQQVQALQSEAQGDTASLLARYGARMAIGSPTPAGSAGAGGFGGFGGFGRPGMGLFGGFGAK
jgi:hypothetical protein